MADKYIDRPLGYFLDRLASSSPEPGGGSVAALTGALGAGLVSMVANLTLGKEKYAAVQAQVAELLKRSEELRARLQELIQEDTEAFGAISLVYKMPRSTEAEKTARTTALQEALKKASQVPLEIARKSVQVAELAQTAAEIGNTAAVSDAGVAVLLANACARSAALNVKINLNSIKDEDYNGRVWAETENLLTRVSSLESRVLQITREKMG